MGELLKEMKAEKLNTGGRTELLQQIMRDMSEEDRKDLKAALDDPAISPTSIANVLTRNGHRISASAISGWRRRRGIR